MAVSSARACAGVTPGFSRAMTRFGAGRPEGEELGGLGGIAHPQRLKVGGQHADDLVAAILHPQRPADDSGIRPEPPRPEIVSQHDLVGPWRAVLTRHEPAAEEHGDAESVEELVADARAAKDLGVPAFRHGQLRVAIDREALE